MGSIYPRTQTGSQNRAGKGQWHRPHPAWVLCSLLCHERVKQMLPENYQDLGAGWTPGLTGHPGWVVQAFLSRKLCMREWVSEWVCACYTPVLRLRETEEEREEEWAQCSLFFIKKRVLKNGILERNVIIHDLRNIHTNTLVGWKEDVTCHLKESTF